MERGAQRRGTRKASWRGGVAAIEMLRESAAALLRDGMTATAAHA